MNAASGSSRLDCYNLANPARDDARSGRPAREENRLGRSRPEHELDAAAESWPGKPGRAAPAHIQLAEELAERIESGELAVGTLLPSERELSRRVSVDRSTVRRAIDRLVARGLVTRQQGRGTFVARPRVRHSTTVLRSHFDELVGQGLIPVSRILARGELYASRSLALILGLRVGEPVYRLERLRIANADPVTISTSFFPARLVPGLLELDLEHSSLYRLMEVHFGARPVRATQSLEPVAAGPREAGLLGVAAGSPLLLVRRTSWDALGRAVEHSRDLHRGDRAEFVGELRSQAVSPGGQAT